MKIKRILLAVFAVMLALCMIPFASFAEEKTVKAEFKLESGNGVGDAKIYSDYSLEALLPAAEVDMSVVTATVMLNNVSGLGVTGQRQFSTTISTGLTGTVNPRSFFTNLYSFSSATANVTVDFDNPFRYTVTGNGSTITGIPNSVSKVRDAWQAFVSHIDAQTKTEDDSYIILAKGSYIKLGTEYLHFDDSYSGNLKIDNAGDLAAMEAGIRDALVLETDYENQGGHVTILLKKGTALALGTSIATLKEDYMVEIEGGSNVSDFLSGNILETFRECSSLSEIISAAVETVDGFAGALESDGSIEFNLHPVDLAKYSLSLNLADEIAINFNVKDIVESADLNLFTVEYAFYGEGYSEDNPPETTTARVTNRAKNTYVVAKCAAKEMGDTVKIKVYYAGAVIKEIDTSIKQYCEAMLETTGLEQKDIDLYTAVLDYGGYSQLMFPYKTDALVNDTYTAGESVISGTTIPDSFKAVSSGTCTGIKRTTVSLNLEYKTDLFFNFTLDDGYTKDDFTFTVAGDAETEIIEREGGVISFHVTKIAAKELGVAKTVTVENTKDESRTITFSPVSWAYGMQGQSDERGIFSKALYLYYRAAAAYFG